MEGIWLVSYIILWILVLALGLLVALLYRQLGIMYLGTAEGVSRDGIAVGSQAPEWSLADVAGQQHNLSEYRGKPALLLFGSPSCEPCQKLLPQLDEFARAHAGAINVLWLNDADMAGSERMMRENNITFPLLVEGGTMMDTYQVRVTPFMFMLDEGGTIRVKGLVNNRAWLERYFDQLRGMRKEAVGR